VPATRSTDREPARSKTAGLQDGHGSRRFWIVATAVGLLLRVVLIPMGAKFPFVWDHDDFVRWGIQATDEGVLTLYDHPPPKWDVRIWQGDRWRVTQSEFEPVCNYPPLSVYLLQASGWVFKAISADRLVNTIASRAAFTGWSIVADFLLAWGCAVLVAHFRPGQAARWTYLLVLLAPPLWIDSMLWGQMESVLLAPAVWMIWALVRQRWVLAGGLYGLMVVLKPQAVLFIPVWGLAIVTARPFWRPLVALPVAAGVVLALGAPFTLHGGESWWHECYVKNLLEAYAKTTLNAYNVWYVDLLICGTDDALLPWLGIAKDAWGKAVLVLALGLGFLWMLRRWRGAPAGLALWAALTLLACVILPTRVHERYIVLVVPFLIVAAMLWTRLWPGLSILLVVATIQVTWPAWLKAEAGQLAALERQALLVEQALIELPPEQHPKLLELKRQLEVGRRQTVMARAETVGFEWFITMLALAGVVATVAAALSLRPEPRSAAAAVS
jgi:Gpi18-like mannosyltransferase